ncbi:MAG TPA: RHS repeat-associated core domain-containing protein, partial [Terriglobales bacterium]|nr:RHS repeat-associated core domain-containing protein [Terriglobales bacterium]
NRNLNRGQRFTYDELNRVKDAWTAGSLWGNSYVYDLWGNLNKKLACLATAPCAGYPQGENLDQTANSKNQFVGMSYDAAGNLTNAGAGVMTYDAENRLVAAGGVTYAYLADGNRVRKAGSGVVDTAYWYGPNGELLAESDLSSNIREEYVFFNGRRVARRTAATGAVVYYFSDHLGSASVITNAAGTIVEESDYYPFGGERIIVNNDPNAYKFTGKERDAETGLDYFIARHYSSSLGRFLQPDEFAGGPVDAFSSNDPLPDSPLPYADISNPQSLNKYAYTYNNPLGYVDPDGHDGFTFLGIPVVYNCRPYCAAEWAHEKQHAADYWNRQMTLKDYEKRAFAAEAKVYENRLQELEQKQASGQKLSPEEQKEMNEIKKERLPTAQNNATDKGATDYVKNTNPGTDPNSTLWNPQPAKQDQQQQNQQQQQQQQKQQQQQQEEKKKKGNRK